MEFRGLRMRLEGTKNGTRGNESRNLRGREAGLTERGKVSARTGNGGRKIRKRMTRNAARNLPEREKEWANASWKRGKPSSIRRQMNGKKPHRDRMSLPPIHKKQEHFQPQEFRQNSKGERVSRANPAESWPGKTKGLTGKSEDLPGQMRDARRVVQTEVLRPYKHFMQKIRPI